MTNLCPSENNTHYESAVLSAPYAIFVSCQFVIYILLYFLVEPVCVTSQLFTVGTVVYF